MLFSKTATRLFVAQAGLLGRYRMASGARAMSLSTGTASSYISRSLTNAYADVHLVPMMQDNYGFIIVDKLSNTCAVVDPGYGLVIEKALNELELSLDVILCTHKHNDHIGGVLDLKRAFPSALVIGTQYEPIPGLEAPVGEGDYFQIGNLPVKVTLYAKVYCTLVCVNSAQFIIRQYFYVNPSLTIPITIYLLHR